MTLQSRKWGGKRPGAGAPLGNGNAAKKPGDLDEAKKPDVWLPGDLRLLEYG